MLLLRLVLVLLKTCCLQVWRSIGWRVFVGAAATYGLLYGVERLAWQFRTRKQVFKRQFVDYVKPQLISLVHPSATSGTHQVQEYVLVFP